MKISISDIITTENLEEEKTVETDLVSFSSRLGCFPIIKKEPFTLSLENQENKRLLVSGRTEVTLAIPCDRCLEEVPVRVPLVFQREYSLEEPEPEEASSEEDEDCLVDSSLDIDKLVYHEILLKRPMKVLCSEGCKGICRKCGINLNHETCSCDQTELDPRMAAFLDVFNQYKEV